MGHSGQKHLVYYDRFPLSPLGSGDSFDFGAALTLASGGDLVVTA